MIKESKFSFTQIYMSGAFLLALLTLVVYLLSHADNALHTKAASYIVADYEEHNMCEVSGLRTAATLT